MQEFIKLSLEYIEQNLRTDITADELAEMANYSAGHFCRLFVQSTELTVASYILKRRLDHALAEISSGRKAIGVVMEYGFDTYAGFYKAFVKMYGCSPKKYLSIYKKSEVIIMQSEKDIRAILENWDISQGLKIEDASTTDWQTGAVQWQIWDIGGEYHLKTNERSKVIRNLRIAKAMKKEGLSSEFLPIPTRQGEDYLDGKHIFLLTKKFGEPLITRPMPSEELWSMAFNENRRKYAYNLGQAIAKFHRALKTVQDDVMPYEGNLYEQGHNAIPKVKQDNLGIGEGFYTDYIETFGGELYDKLPKQLIHGNLCGDAVVYENGEVTGIKGYEIYNLSFPRIYDITWGAGEIRLQPLFDEYLTTLTEMLKGYDSINPLTVEEKQSIYYVLCATYLKGYVFHPPSDATFDLHERGNCAMTYLANNKDKFMNLL